MKQVDDRKKNDKPHSTLIKSGMQSILAKMQLVRAVLYPKTPAICPFENNFGVRKIKIALSFLEKVITLQIHWEVVFYIKRNF